MQRFINALLHDNFRTFTKIVKRVVGLTEHEHNKTEHEHNKIEHEHNKKAGGEQITLGVYAAVAVLVLVLAFNQYQISSISNAVSLYSGPALSNVQLGTSTVAANQPSQANLQALVDKVIPKGVPAVYGAELGVSYDQPVQSLTVLGKLDGDLYPDGKLKFSGLSADAQKRYVAMGKMIACEYCCGATELVFPDGKPACGCQHSAAMRGLAKYLLLKHPDVSDAQILEEMAKWKILFFPKQHITKALSFESAGMQSKINPTDLASNQYRNFKAPEGSSSSSGSSGSAQGVQGIANAPNMVGGC